MYTIKVSNSLFGYISDELRLSVETLAGVYEDEMKAVGLIGDCRGFGITNIADDISEEIKRLEMLADDIQTARNKSERTAAIYAEAEKRAERLINALPVLIHDSISENGGRSSYFKVGGRSEVKMSESAAVSDNAVMHEDWLAKLIITEKFGG